MKIYFKEEWLDAISFLPSVVRGKIFDAVFTYLRYHELPKDIDGEAKVAFLFIKREIDKDEARREAARRRKALREGKIEKVEETSPEHQEDEEKSETECVTVVLNDMGPNPERIKYFLRLLLKYKDEDFIKFQTPGPWVLLENYPKERTTNLVRLIEERGGKVSISS